MFSEIVHDCLVRRPEGFGVLGQYYYYSLKIYLDSTLHQENNTGLYGSFLF